MINVIVVSPESGQLRIRTFKNIDDQDASGGEAAEKAFIEEVEKIFPNYFIELCIPFSGNKKEHYEQYENAVSDATEDGFVEKDGYQFYLIHSYVENIQE